MVAFVHDGKISCSIIRDTCLYVQDLESKGDFMGMLSVRPEAPSSAVTLTDVIMMQVPFYKMARKTEAEFEEFLKGKVPDDEQRAKVARFAVRPFLCSLLAFDSSGRVRRQSLLSDNIKRVEYNGRRKIGKKVQQRLRDKYARKRSQARSTGKSDNAGATGTGVRILQERKEEPGSSIALPSAVEQGR